MGTYFIANDMNDLVYCPWKEEELKLTSIQLCGTAISKQVITIDDFITDDECERLKELGGHKGYERSTDVGAKKFDGTFEAKKSKTRTSENAWCTDECFEDPLSQTALKRIELLTGVSDSNSEYLQLLKYETGQFYRTHHDYIEADDERPQGPRILTAFLYLNDVEAGGGTNFPDLDLTVMPKKGRLLLWPSVIDSDPSKKDFTTRHQALNVDAGEKYGANAWLHLRDFKAPHAAGCTQMSSLSRIKYTIKSIYMATQTTLFFSELPNTYNCWWARGNRTYSSVQVKEHRIRNEECLKRTNSHPKKLSRGKKNQYNSGNA